VFKMNFSPISINWNRSSFNPSTISKLMRTSFDNHIRNSFSSMPNIQVYPFLNLKDKRFFCNILNSHSCWIWTVKSKSSHNYNRISEISFNFNSMPCFSIWLFHGDFTIFNNSIVTF
jgi:hypothetical protein